MADLVTLLRPARVATPEDGQIILELAAELLADLADDPENPRMVEKVAACELAIATYHALAGDWTIADALKMVAKQDAATRTKHAQTLATGRADAKAAWTRSVQDIVLRTRAVKNLTDGVRAKREAGKVVPFRRKAG